MPTQPVFSQPDVPWSAETAGMLEAMLPVYVAARRWFRSKASVPDCVRLLDVIPLTPRSAVTIVETSAGRGPKERYVLPLTALRGERADVLEHERSPLVIARLASGELLCDGLADPEALSALAALFATTSERRGRCSLLRVERVGERVATEGLVPHPLSAEQSNSSIVFGNALILKIFRRLDVGMSAELEVGRALTEAGFARAAPVHGALTWTPDGGAPSTLAILQGYVPNDGVAWERALQRLANFLARHTDAPPAAAHSRPWPEAAEGARAGWLGKRTAELHATLAACEGAAFTPVPFTLEDQVAAVDRLVPTVHPLLMSLQQLLPANRQVIALLARSEELTARLSGFRTRAFGGQRIRIHGDLHLGQVLEQGSDAVFIDFEGEPARTLEARRAKRSPLADVAGMLRSYHYAAVSAARAASDTPNAQLWMKEWHGYVTACFLDGYRDQLGDSELLPTAERMGEALAFFCFEKCLYELGYELNNRPDWVGVPLTGLLSLLESPHS